jgi:hypothetical protein
MDRFALVMSAAFGSVVTIGVTLTPGALTTQKVLAVGTATLVTLLVAVVLASELKSRP